MEVAPHQRRALSTLEVTTSLVLISNSRLFTTPMWHRQAPLCTSTVSPTHSLSSSDPAERPPMRSRPARLPLADPTTSPLSPAAPLTTTQTLDAFRRLLREVALLNSTQLAPDRPLRPPQPLRLRLKRLPQLLCLRLPRLDRLRRHLPPPRRLLPRPLPPRPELLRLH